MSPVYPKGEKIKNALRLISEERKKKPEQSPAKLVDKASFQFDLSPKESLFLLRLIKND